MAFGPTAEPRNAVPVPFWVTRSAVPGLVVVTVVFEVPAVLLVLPRMRGSPAAAEVGSGPARRVATRAASEPATPASRARRDLGADGSTTERGGVGSSSTL